MGKFTKGGKYLVVLNNQKSNYEIPPLLKFFLFTWIIYQL